MWCRQGRLCRHNKLSPESNVNEKLIFIKLYYEKSVLTLKKSIKIVTSILSRGQPKECLKLKKPPDNNGKGGRVAGGCSCRRWRRKWIPLFPAGAECTRWNASGLITTHSEAQYVRIPGKMWFVLPLSSGRDRWRCKSVRVCVTGVLMWSYVQHVPCSPDR